MKSAIPFVFAAVAVASVHAGHIQQSAAASNSSDCGYACPDVYVPVCGSDGVTYPNECSLNLANCEHQEQVTQVSDGECSTAGSTSETSSCDGSGSKACPDVCPMIYKPVCGSDGVTYGNDCLLGVAACKSGGDITQVSNGQCPSTSTSGSAAACPEVCIEIYKPVCGTDGVTYANSCFLGIATCKDPSITQASDGACVASEGSYGTKSNSVSSSEERSSYGDDSSTASSSACPKVCIEIYKPVCGTDGVTYANSCFLGIATCKDPSITQASDGACVVSEGSYGTKSNSVSSSEERSSYGDDSSTASSSSSACPKVCIEIYKPVCGTDGVTYANSCFLGIATCKDPSITQASDGACEGSYRSVSSSEERSAYGDGSSTASPTACPEVCTTLYAPVCGSDGVTYGNECELEAASCKHPKLHLTKVSDKACSADCKTQF